jgi:phosphoribosylpyrophosphate synthetase
LIKELVSQTGIEEIYLGASHNLCLRPALERLGELIKHAGLKRITFTNSIPQTEEFLALPGFTVRDISGALGQVILHIHQDRPVSAPRELPG